MSVYCITIHSTLFSHHTCNFGNPMIIVLHTVLHRHRHRQTHRDTDTDRYIYIYIIDIYTHIYTLYIHLTSILALLQRFVENANVSVCLNELLMVEHNDVRTRVQLAGAAALLAALESCSDAVEICNDENQVQVRGRIYI